MRVLPRHHRSKTIRRQQRRAEMKPFAWSGVVIALMWTSLACAQPVGAQTLAGPSKPAAVITQPNWVRKPDGDDIVASYPPYAMQKGRNGRAVMKCRVTFDGKLTDCSILAEFPQNMGFGKAALTLSNRFQMSPSAADGQSVDGAEITIPIGWSLNRPSNTTRTFTVGGVPWTSTPTQSELIAALPPAAAGKVDRGLVQLSCDIREFGGLAGCKASSAEPPGLGFEAAALSLSKKFGISLQWRIQFDGPVHITIPIQFATADSDIWKTHNLGKIDWLQAPDLQTAQAAFPAAAATAGIASGSAVVNCAVADSGALVGCAPESEDPAGMGFGPAVAEVAGHFVMVPWAATGIPAGGAHIRLPMTLTRGDPAPSPATKP